MAVLSSFIMEPYDDMKEHSFLSFHKYLHVKYINGAGPIFIGKRTNLLSFHHTAYIQSYRIVIVMNRKYSLLVDTKIAILDILEINVDV